MDDMPTMPIGVMQEGAIAMHELFLSYVEVGFTEAQAIALVQAVICGMSIRTSMKGML